MALTVFITGATAGFGQATAERLIADGHRVVATGRRASRLEALRERLGPNLLGLPLDVTDAAAVGALPQSLPEGWREIDVLVANAGLALGLGPAWEADPQDWEQMIRTNVGGAIAPIRALLPGMVARDQGHIVTLGSVAASYPYPGGNVYGGTKAFISQFMRNLKADLVGTRVRTTNIEPGLVGGSEFSNVRLRDDAKAAAVYRNADPLLPEDIAETIAWVIGLPPRVNINSVELMPVTQSAGAFTIKRREG